MKWFFGASKLNVSYLILICTVLRLIFYVELKFDHILEISNQKFQKIIESKYQTESQTSIINKEYLDFMNNKSNITYTGSFLTF